LEPTAAAEWLKSPDKTVLGERDGPVRVIDIRAAADFAKEAVLGARNLPLESVKPGMPSPFNDVTVLERQWIEMKKTVGLEQAWREVIEAGGSFLTICYDGESARVLTSILRASGVEAYSARGGFPSLMAVQTV
jgi:rhodanese-related sulfurtransferase